MYHQLCRATGRLVAAKTLQTPLYPVAPIALQKADPPAIVYTSNQMSTVTEASCPAPGKRRLIPGTNIPFPPVDEKIKQQQAKFQTDDDVPVFLKGGPADKILYRFTMLLCIVGLVGVFDVIYTHSVPRK